MIRRLTVMAWLLCVVCLTTLNGGGCSCRETIRQIVGSFALNLSPLNNVSLDAVGPTQLPDTVVITNADLRLDPLAEAAGMRAASAGREADFEGATAHRGTIHLTGYYAEEASRVAIFLTTLVPLQAGDSVSMTMQVTFTSDDHAAGTVQYVEDGQTFAGTVELERYPE